VQLARHTLARVAATVGDADKAAFVRALGAERIIEYKQEDFVQATLDWTGGAGVDMSFDTVGGETFCKSFAATRVYGQVVTLLQPVCDVNAMKTARTRNQGIHYELMLTPMFLGLHASPHRRRAHHRQDCFADRIDHHRFCRVRSTHQFGRTRCVERTLHP
jgi:NADPH2:quinone reductase